MDLLTYSLSVYFLYWVLGQSAIFKPRGWVMRTLPKWLTYPLNCAFCFTWWTGLGLILIGVLDGGMAALFAAPVVNMIVDGIVRVLVRANEPPVIRIDPPTTVTWQMSSSTPQTYHGRSIPAGWAHTDRDSSLYRISGVVRWWPEKHINRRVLVCGGPHEGRKGKIDNGEGPPVFVSGMDITPFSYFIVPDDKRTTDMHDGRIKVNIDDCTFLD